MSDGKRGILENRENEVEYLVRRFHNLIIGESQHDPSVVKKPAIPDVVLLDERVSVAIGLDDQTATPAREIRDIWSDGVLSTEANAELLVP
jgi:hypothetical protein